MTDDPQVEAEPCRCQLTFCGDTGHDGGKCPRKGRHRVQGAFYQPLWVCAPCARAHESPLAENELERVERTLAVEAGQQQMFC